VAVWPNSILRSESGTERQREDRAIAEIYPDPGVAVALEDYVDQKAAGNDLRQTSRETSEDCAATVPEGLKP
jgi:hypothetical protein